MNLSRSYPLFIGSLCWLIVLQGGCRQQSSDPLPQTQDKPAAPREGATVDVLAQQRETLDRTVWEPEVDAQQFEQPIIAMWDRLRASADPLNELAKFPLREIEIGSPQNRETLDLQIERISFAEPTIARSQAEWQAQIREWGANGYRLEESEWHHSSFRRDGERVRSTVDFVLHVKNDRVASPRTERLIVRGRLEIDWEVTRSETLASPASASAGTVEHRQRGAEKVRVVELTILTRSGELPFQKVFTYDRKNDDVASAFPILVSDLDGNGQPEIVISRWNRLYWNEGRGKFREARLLDHFVPLQETGLLAHVSGDGQADLVTVNKSGELILYRSDARGRFPSPPVVACDVKIENASAMTAGDIDHDGDVDLWVTQYKPSYLYGQMPTPYYDANDGEPAYLLQNDGTGHFVDITESAGLSPKRFRRTYSCSFLDLDHDGHLDLWVVSDYAGVDIYRNDGQGNFTDCTEQLVGERHLFGMAHTFGDYNLDGQLDIYAIGMSSTTARRLDGMKLGRDDRADVHKMRAAMGFGNRMYLGTAEGRYVQPPFYQQVARTGWSWGTTSCDFDLDGDQDIYVANGFRSGKSCQDYCTTFWRHDIYTGSSRHDSQVAQLFTSAMQDLNAGAISWNGYEHNAFLLNLSGSAFVNVGYLLGIGSEYDARAVIGTDLDGDGRPDLLVSEYQFAGRGFITRLHVYRNRLQTESNWIGVRLDGPAKSGVWGAVVRLATQDRPQVRCIVSGDSFLSQHPHVAHFGLGQQTQVQQIEVLWPNGERQVVNSPEINRYLDIRPDTRE